MTFFVIIVEKGVSILLFTDPEGCLPLQRAVDKAVERLEEASIDDIANALSSNRGAFDTFMFLKLFLLCSDDNLDSDIVSDSLISGGVRGWLAVSTAVDLGLVALVGSTVELLQTTP